VIGGRAIRVAVMAAVATLPAAGCATSEPTATGSTGEDQKGRDTADCLSTARAIVASPKGPRTVVNQDRYQECMRERGHAAAPAR
jgi:hypothetical protein